MSYIEDRDSSLRETAFDQTLPADPGEVSIKGKELRSQVNCQSNKFSPVIMIFSISSKILTSPRHYSIGLTTSLLQF